MTSIKHITTTPTPPTPEDVFLLRPAFGNFFNPASVLRNLEDQATAKPEPSTEVMEVQSGDSVNSLMQIPMDVIQKLGGPDSYLFKLLEDVGVITYYLCRAKSYSDYTMAVVTFCKLRSGKSFKDSLMNVVSRVFATQVQDFEDVSEQLTHYLDKYETVRELPLFKKVHRLLMYCIGFSVFEKAGVNFDLARFMEVEKEATARKYHRGRDFVHSILDTTLFLCTRGHQCMITGSISPMFHSKENYEKFGDDVNTLIRKARYVSNPEPHGFTVFQFLSELDSAIERGEAICKYHRDVAYVKNTLNKLVGELKIIRSDCLTKKLAQQDRKAPFALLVSGGSSIGKSTFTKLLYYHLGKYWDLPTTPEYRYVRNPIDPYWVNFNSSQWFVQLDDIAFLHPNSSQGCDPSLMEMLQVVNNVPFVPIQADLCDKGRTPLRARCVVATTNTETLNAEKYFACPLAVQRRLPYVISIVPKPEFAKDGCMLDGSRVLLNDDGTYPDLWLISVKRVIPAPVTAVKSTHMGQTATFENVRADMSMTQFILWLNETADKANAVQDKSDYCDKHMSSVILCKCGMPTTMCVCGTMAPQAGGDEVLPPVHDRIVPAGGVHPDEEEAAAWSFGDWAKRVWRERGMATSFDDDGDYYVDFAAEVQYEPFWRRCVFWSFYKIMNWYTRYVMSRGLIAQWFFASVFGGWAYWYIFIWASNTPVGRRWIVRFLGHRVRFVMTRNRTMTILIASLTVAVAAWKVGNLAKNVVKSLMPTKEELETVQGASQSVGVTPPPETEQRENVWYKDNYECSSFDVSAASLSQVGMTVDFLRNLIAQNCVFFTITTFVGGVRSRGIFTRALCTGGHNYLCNNHGIPEGEFELEITLSHSKDGVTRNTKCIVSPGMVRRHPSKDLCIIVLNCLPPRRSLVRYFPLESYRGQQDAHYVSRGPDGGLYTNFVRNTAMDFHRVEDECLPSVFESFMWKGKADTPTLRGHCGSVLFCSSPLGPLILGIHMLGAESGQIGAVSVNAGWLEAQLPETILGGEVKLSVQNFGAVLGPLSKKSPVRYMDDGTATVYGSFVGFRGKMKSRVRPTHVSAAMVARGYRITTGVPDMTWAPWYLSLKDSVRPVTAMNADTLALCRRQFSHELVAGLSQEYLDMLVVYDNVTAVNGAPGVLYVDKLNRNTSAGFPFNTSKKYFLNSIPAMGDLQHPVEMTPIIEEEVDRILEVYSRGERCCPVFRGALKDETRPLKKVASKQTRTICGAALPWTIVVRKYLLSIIRVLQNNRVLFESGPGTIAQSAEWDDLYHYITAHGPDQIVAGDYAKFDKRMPAIVVKEAFNVLIDILRAAGWGEKDILIVRCIAEDTAFPLVDYNGDLIEFYGTNPSGHPLTVVINGIASCLYLRYCYHNLNPAHEIVSFKANVNTYTYGDDLIMGVSKSIPWFNHTTIQAELAAVDIGFTMADKEAPSEPYIHISDATFLRRSWSYCAELGKYVCPLEHESINKMLTMGVASKTISPQLQSVDVMDTAMREYFWYGKPTFDSRRRLFMDVIVELNLAPYMWVELPTWDKLVAEYKRYSGAD